MVSLKPFQKLQGGCSLHPFSEHPKQQSSLEQRLDKEAAGPDQGVIHIDRLVHSFKFKCRVLSLTKETTCGMC